MPKSYSEKERTLIIEKLKLEAKNCMIQFGIKKTTVDELVKRVNIPKGTFYLFYRSKELLFFDVISEIHNEIQQILFTRLMPFNGNINKDDFADILFEFYKLIDEIDLLQTIVNGDLELLMRKLPEDVIAEHQARDDFNMEELLKMIPTAKNKNIQEFSGAFRAIFLTTLHKKEIGEDCFDASLKLLLQGLSNLLFEETTK